MESNHSENLSPHSKESALFNLYKLGAIAAAVLSILIGIVLYHYHMNESRYFINTSATTVSLILLAMNIGFALTPIFLFKKDISTVADHFPTVKYHFSLPAASAIICSVAIIALSPFSTLSTITAVLAIPSSLYTLLMVFDRSKAWTCITGYLHILFLIATIALLYMDFNVELNAPLKLSIQFTAMAAIMSTLSDLRITIGKESVGLYTFSKIAFLALALFTTTGVILESIPKYESYGIAYVILPLYLLSLAIPTSIRFFCSTLRAKTPTASDKG